MIQLPGDIHRFFAVVLYIVRCAEIGIGGSTAGNTIRLEFAHEQQNATAFFTVVNMAQFVYASHLVRYNGEIRLYFNARDTSDMLKGRECIGFVTTEKRFGTMPGI